MGAEDAGDPENLRRLREEAVRRVQREERAVAPVYGGPPLPRRRWWRVMLPAIVAVLAALVVWLLTHRNSVVNPAPVYGGPPRLP